MDDQVFVETVGGASNNDGGYRRKSILNISGVNWPDHTGRYPVLYNCNIGEGCSHDCLYCYGPLVLKVKRSEWRKWKPVVNAVELLRKEAPIKPPGRVMFSSTTEPYMDPYMARKCLEILLNSHHYTLIITKRPNVVNDIDILKGRDNVEVGFTITALNDSGALRKWEPNAPSVLDRILAAEAVHKEGIKTYASVEPWIPKITHPLEIVQKLDGIIDRWVIGAMNYMHQDHKQYLPELKETVAWLDDQGKPYYLKRELQRLLGIDMDGFQTKASEAKKPRTGGADMRLAARRAWIKIWEQKGRQDKADALRIELGIAPGEYR